MEAGIREQAGEAEEETGMKEQREQRCRKCGAPIAVISWGIYRKAIVDPEAVWVTADSDGDQYIRIDGSKVMAKPAGHTITTGAEPAYRPHKCGGRR